MRINWKIVSAILLAILVIGSVGGGAAYAKSKQREQREASIAARAASFSRAEALYPAPTDLQNFPQRKALVEFTRRQDEVNHPFYIYLLSMNGEYIGYYVGQTYPISTCNFLSSTEDVADASYEGAPVLTAPSYDGMFYGGGGASAACQTMFFFDAETNALVTFADPFWFASDYPLNVNAPKISSAPS